MRGQLKLDPMAAVNDAPLGTAFTVSIDLSREGLTTGISARERAATVHALANSNVPERTTSSGPAMCFR